MVSSNHRRFQGNNHIVVSRYDEITLSIRAITSSIKSSQHRRFKPPSSIVDSSQPSDIQANRTFKPSTIHPSRHLRTNTTSWNTSRPGLYIATYIVVFIYSSDIRTSYTHRPSKEKRTRLWPSATVKVVHQLASATNPAQEAGRPRFDFSSDRPHTNTGIVRPKKRPG